MDHQRFDDLARLISGRRGRRGFLRGLATALLAATWIRDTSRAAQTDCPERCDDDEVCHGGICRKLCEVDRHCRSKKTDPCMLDLCIDGFCEQAIVDCQPGYECCDGACCSKPCADDAECAVFDPCLIGTCSEGLCVFSALDPCLTCESDDDCTNAGHNVICCEGVCRAPCPDGTVMGKGCECQADSSAVIHGIVVRDDASGIDGARSSSAQSDAALP